MFTHRLNRSITLFYTGIILHENVFGFGPND